AKQVGWATTLHLAFQSLGVVYGDMGTSPLYVFSSTFTGGIKDTDDLLGVMSLIIYTVLLLPLMKYCFIVLRVFLVTILATSMVIGDGVLTPCISGDHPFFLKLISVSIK
uniref:K+ potassium transporter integral membrane domain-containing protein n=1 Tax=Aegilops tauschii subsp. strangulata TaxID=200361 RepID=A0A453GFE8_AEGTS